jgi:hypothetical protein
MEHASRRKKQHFFGCNQRLVQSWKQKAKKGNKDRKSVEGMTGAQGEYPLDILKDIFG